MTAPKYGNNHSCDSQPFDNILYRRTGNSASHYFTYVMIVVAHTIHVFYTRSLTAPRHGYIKDFDYPFEKAMAKLNFAIKTVKNVWHKEHTNVQCAVFLS